MIVWSKKLYLGETIKKSSNRIIRKIERRKIVRDIFCITFASNPDNLFDIMNVSEFKFPYYDTREITIIGLCKGKEEAQNLAKDMLEEIYQNTGEFKVRDYFI